MEEREKGLGLEYQSWGEGGWTWFREKFIVQNWVIMLEIIG